jgi:hypothetical protein
LLFVSLDGPRENDKKKYLHRMVTAAVRFGEADATLGLGGDDTTVPADSARGDGTHVVQRAGATKRPGARGVAEDGTIGAATGRRGDDWNFGLIDGRRRIGIGIAAGAGLGAVTGNGSLTGSLDIRAGVLELDGLDTLRDYAVIVGVCTEHGWQGLEALLVLIVAADHDSSALHVHLTVAALVEPGPVKSSQSSSTI